MFTTISTNVIIVFHKVMDFLRWWIVLSLVYRFLVHLVLSYWEGIWPWVQDLDPLTSGYFCILVFILLHLIGHFAFNAMTCLNFLMTLHILKKNIESLVNYKINKNHKTIYMPDTWIVCHVWNPKWVAKQ
jgi:hypothetical protein